MAQEAQPQFGEPLMPETCQDHGQPRNLFCHSCVTLICGGCILPSHDGHFIDNVQNSLKRGLQLRNSLSWQIERIINELVIGKKKVDSTSRSVTSRFLLARERIKSYIDRCRSSLDDRKETCMKNLSLCQSYKRTSLLTQILTLTEHLENLEKIHDKLSFNFSLTDPVKQTALIREGTTCLESAQSEDLTPAANTTLNFVSNDSILERIRYGLGILSVGENIRREPDEDVGYNSPVEIDD